MKENMVLITEINFLRKEFKQMKMQSKIGELEKDENTSYKQIQFESTNYDELSAAKDHELEMI
jgi:hypothetical protein